MLSDWGLSNQDIGSFPDDGHSINYPDYQEVMRLGKWVHAANEDAGLWVYHNEVWLIIQQNSLIDGETYTVGYDIKLVGTF